jgi:hypothetical protein
MESTILDPCARGCRERVTLEALDTTEVIRGPGDRVLILLYWSEG